MGLLRGFAPAGQLFVAHFGGGGVGLEGEVGGFFEEIFAELVEGFLARGPEDLLVFFSFEAFSAEVVHKEAVFVGWADGRCDAGGEFEDVASPTLQLA